MILFLDFDGVLHHENVTLKRVKSSSVRWLKDNEKRYLTHTGYFVRGVALFEHVGRLEASLAPFPDVRIVLTTSWREHFRPGSLLKFLTPALAARIIGQTPHCDKYGGVGSRLYEVLAYLKGNGLADEPWVALDDQAQLFWDHTENPPDSLFILGKDGLTEATTVDFCRFLECHMQSRTQNILTAGHEEPYRSLMRILHGGRFKLVLLQFNDTVYRDALITKINDVVTTPAVLHITNEAFPNFHNMEARLAELARQHALIHVTGLDHWLPIGAPNQFIGFNYHRDAIAENSPVSLLLWLTKEHICDFATLAPDMWAWRSAVLNFSLGKREVHMGSHD